MNNTNIMEKVKPLLSSRIFQLTIGIVLILSVFAALQYFQGGKLSVSGTFVLSDSKMDFNENEECYGTGGYDDIESGTQIKVLNGSGDIIAVSKLESGKMEDANKCIFKFDISDMPRSKVYQFEVSDRGEIAYSHKELVEDEYFIELSLGN